MEINRREWMLQTGALAAAGGAFGQPTPAKGWYDRPMRWAQLAFVEDDPGRYDPAFWLDYFKRIHADAVRVSSAGGCVAFYPTKVPLHYRSKFLVETADAFGENAGGLASKLGMHVIARVGSPRRAFRTSTMRTRIGSPWKPNGQPRRHWAMPTSWVYLRAGALQLRVHDGRDPRDHDPLQGRRDLREPPGTGPGMCYCQHCQRSFKEFSGLELPTNHGNGRRRAHSVHRVAAETPLGDVYALGGGDQEAQPGRRVLSECATTRYGTAFRFRSSLQIGRLAPATPCPGRTAETRRSPAQPPERSPSWASSVWDWKRPTAGRDSVQNPNEIRLWAVDGIAQGFRPWFTKFNAKPLDRRWFKPVEDLYVWHWKNDTYMRNERPLARVGLGVRVSGCAKITCQGSTTPWWKPAFLLKIVRDSQFDEARVQQLKVLALPNVAKLVRRAVRAVTVVRRKGRRAGGHARDLAQR